MKEHYNKLQSLLEQLPTFYSVSNAEKAKNIASQYGDILNYVIRSSDDHKRNLQFWPGELKDTEELLRESIGGKSRKAEKFKEAVRHLRDDIEDLASRIKHFEGFSETTNQAPGE